MKPQILCGDTLQAVIERRATEFGRTDRARLLRLKKTANAGKSKETRALLRASAPIQRHRARRSG